MLSPLLRHSTPDISIGVRGYHSRFYAQNTNALISFVGNVSANSGMPFLVLDITSSAFHSVPM